MVRELQLLKTPSTPCMGKMNTMPSALFPFWPGIKELLSVREVFGQLQAINRPYDRDPHHQKSNEVEPILTVSPRVMVTQLRSPPDRIPFTSLGDSIITC